MNSNDIETALQWRYATQQFDRNRKISDSDWKALEQSLLLAPSSYGLQPWKFLLVEDPKLREELKAVSWNQTKVTDCSHYVVLLYKKLDREHIVKHVDRTAELRNIEREKLVRYEEMMVSDLLVKGPRTETIETWARAQTYIAMGFLLQTAAMMKIDACPMEGLDPDAYDKILGINGSSYKTITSVALGYRDPGDRYQNLKKVRFELSDIIQKI